MQSFCKRPECLFKQGPSDSSSCLECATGLCCEHDEIIWDPVEIQYLPDGTASMYQTGICNQCGKTVILTYLPGKAGLSQYHQQ